MLQWVRHTSTLYGMKSGLQLFQRVYRFIKVFWMVRHSIRAILYNARNDLSMHRLVTEHPRATREKWQARFASGPTAYGVNPDYSHAESRKERSGPNARCSFVKLSSTRRPFFFFSSFIATTRPCRVVSLTNLQNQFALAESTIGPKDSGRNELNCLANQLVMRNKNGWAI